MRDKVTVMRAIKHNMERAANYVYAASRGCHEAGMANTTAELDKIWQDLVEARNQIAAYIDHIKPEVK